MIAVNELIQRAYESLNMVNLGDAVDGDMAVVGCNELNRLITQLNNEGFIAMAQKWVDVPCANVIYFRKLIEGEERTSDTVDMVPPDKLEAVARKIGDRFIVLNNGNSVQMSQKNPYTIALSWTYDTELETTPDDHVPNNRVVGILRLDGNPRNQVRVWYNSKIANYKLDDTIYLSDLYNELLMAGLCMRLGIFYELSQEKKADLARDVLTAKTLIKRNNITQRMLMSGQIMGDYRDPYFNGLNGVGM